MKRIILTESQYKRLVKQKLNEYIVYSDPKDEYDVTPDIRLYLGTLGQNLKIKYDINTYVSKIEDGIVYLVADKYNEEQKKTISDIIDYWIKYTPEDDEKIGEIDYFSGLDWDYGDEEIEDVEDVEDTEEIEDVEVKGEFGLDSLIDGEKLILYLISEKEAVNHSYDSAYPGKIIEGLSDLTIEEVKSKYGSGAKGRYQFLPKYFKIFVDKSGLNMSDKFSPKNQDKMALDIFKDKMGNCLKLEDKLVRTWAALPVLYGRKGDERYVNRGQSYYAGDGVNKAHIKADHFEKVLRSCGCDMSDLEEKLNDKKTKTVDAPSIVGNSSYILGKEIIVDKNGPKNHASRSLGNWQSDNATDIFGTPGTTVYSITKGTVSKIGGNDEDHTGKIYGGSITVKGKDGYPDIFYTHLQKIKVVKGQEVTLGTPLAEISLWETSPKGSHVHVGLPYGTNLNSVLNLDTGKIK